MSDLASREDTLGESQLIPRTEQSRMISNKQDPMQRLPLETIQNIIRYVDAEDTEKLRRLSKRWKSASEAFNTKQAISRHFPLRRCPPLATGLQYNLLFRRLLYHNSSLKRGRVTRSHHFSDVSHWTLRGNKLVLIDHNDEVLIYDLTSRSSNRLEVEHCMLKSVRESPPHTIVDGFHVSFTGHGEIIVHHRTWPHGMPNTVTTLAKISNDLHSQWSMSVYWCVVATGIDRVYGIVIYDGRLDTRSRLVTRRADTGAEISDICIVGSLPPQTTKFFMEVLGATMTSNEQFLIFKNYNHIICLIDVLSGRAVEIPGSISIEVKSYSIFLHPESPDFRVSLIELENENQFKIYDYLYDEKSAAYNAALISTVDSWKRDLGCGSYVATSVVPASDLPNNLLYMVDRCTDDNEDQETWDGWPLRGGTCRKGIWGFSIGESEIGEGIQPMTIPSDEGRADLLFPIIDGPGTGVGQIGMHEHFGMIDGYLIYHDADNRRLLVADFWPSW